MTPTSTEQTAADPVMQTAEVIPFPMRPTVQALPVQTPVVQAIELLPHERLARALETLNAALAEQRAAIAAWRGALEELKTSAAGLGESLQRYRTSLGTLGDGVSALHTQTAVLRDWADQVASTQE
jgi:hypothetical protein